MHSNPPPRNLSLVSKPQDSRGFSLVEVALALGIVAFAFVSLFGLLPAGLTTFRNAIDTGNEARIVQSFVSKVIATDFENLKTKVDYASTNEIVYFDEEGTQVDTSIKQVPSKMLNRIYAAKLFVDDPIVPTDTNTFQYSKNVVIVFANLSSPAAKEFDDYTANLTKLRDHLKQVSGRTNLKIRPVLISKMDGK
jgi:uncharacterized protein (TIGR02598 family)